MLSVVTFKWKPHGGRKYRSTFGPETVNVLARMVRRHYPHPHRFICITDDDTGLDAGIEPTPLWPDYADVQNPNGAHQPSCYRRLKLFAPGMDALIGPRFVCLDLDTVITGDLSSLWNRTEDFIIWGETNPKSWYNGSMFLMTVGSRRQVWERFDPKTSPREAFRAGRFGSDQGWISHCLGKGEAIWTRDDGVYSYRVHIQPNGNRLPGNATVVMFHGKQDPWSYASQQVDWIRRCYQ